MPDNNYYILQKGDGNDWNEKTVLAQEGKVLGWDSNGNPVAVTPGGGAGTLIKVAAEVLDVAEWTTGTTYEEYEVSNGNIEANSLVMVVVHNASADIASAAELLPQVTVGTGTVTLYAINTPTDDITVDIWIGLSSVDSADFELVANKETSALDTSTTKYPCNNVVKSAVDGKMTNPMTTEGDIVYGGTSGTPTRLGKGTGSQYLAMKSDGSIPEWITFSGMPNPMTTKGDIVVALTAGAPARLGVGSANQFLRTNGAGDDVEWGSYSSYNVIQDEGTPLQARTTLNFVGAGVTAEDDLINSKTKITINADVVSIESSVTDNQIVRMNLTSGKSIQASSATIDDNGSINIPTGESYKINGAAHTHARTEQSHVIIADEVKVPSGDTDYIPPFFVFVPSGSLTLKSIRYRINSGTSATFKLQKNGSDITNYTSLSCTTTAATTTQDESLADNDVIAVVVTAVSGTPKNMSVSFRFERSQ
jgi:hypothetical protein